MNSVKDLRNALADEFGNLASEADFEGRMIARARARRSADHKTSGTHVAGRSEFNVESPRLLALVAAVLALAIVASLLLTARGLKVAHPVPARGVPTTKPIPVMGPSALDCPTNCQQPVLTFASPNIIWAVVDSTSDGRSTVYRTTDAGTTWHPLASWIRMATPSEGLGADRLVSASADGKEVVILEMGSGGGTVIHSADGGIHWLSYGLPTSLEPSSSLPVYFLNPREGWLVSPESGQSTPVDDLFHTTDSGATWQLSGRVAITNDFDLSRGSLVFASSKEAWFVPAYRASSGIAHTVYRSHDSGLTWTAVSLAAPVVAPIQYKPGSYAPFGAAIVELRFFNPNQGVIELQGGVCTSWDTTCGPWPEGTIYAYTTSDGGDTFSPPRLIAASGVIDFVNPADWVRIVETSTDSGTAFSTAFSRDSGKTWYAAKSSPPGDPRSLRFVDAMDGWEWGAYCLPTVFRTVDGGAHWTTLELPVAAGPTCGM